MHTVFLLMENSQRKLKCLFLRQSQKLTTAKDFYFLYRKLKGIKGSFLNCVQTQHSFFFKCLQRDVVLFMQLKTSKQTKVLMTAAV